MADCEEQVFSNDYYDFIIGYDEVIDLPPIEGVCSQRIEDNYDIFFYSRDLIPDTDLIAYSYSAVPKCFGLLDQTALEASGIIRLQNQPVLSLKGQGVLVGFLDTGIDYTNPLFQFSDGSTRIERIWDQTIRSGKKPEGFIYGTEYTRDDINRALASENPLEIVPSRDEDGHGTFLAGVACGSEDAENDFIGAAPLSEIVVVKLKQAKQYLRDYYFIPDGEPAYQENDIMAAIAYLHGLANARNVPLALCVALGNNMGSHGKDGPLSTYLNFISSRRKRACVTATGNEANARHHFQGRITADVNFEDVEINVEQNMGGFFVELWAPAPELYTVSVISPTGEQIPKVPFRSGSRQVFDFTFEGTTVSIDYRIIGRETGSQLIYFRFINPSRGLWTIRVFPQNIIDGVYNMWLPMRRLMGGEVYFLRSNPDITLTIPGTAIQPITVGGYQVENKSLYLNSGRGYTLSGDVKPDFNAPAVNVFGPGLRSSYVTFTGTSAAAAITTGACAQVLEWAVVNQRDPTITTAGIKNMFIRGANRQNDRSYPNREWGYGTLEAYQAFENLRL